MKTTFKLGLLGLAAAASVAYSTQSFAANETGNASVLILTAVTLNEVTAMNFASVLPIAGGDTVTLTSGGGISAGGASVLVGTPAAGAFEADGTASTPVSISFSSGDILDGPGADIPIGTFTHSAGGSPAFDGSGNLDFTVGAAITIGAAQTAGSYVGTYTVTVDY